MTPDGRFAVVVGSNSPTPISLVDLDSGAEVDDVEIDAIGTFATACDGDRSVLVLLNGNQLDVGSVRRFTIQGASLVDTGEAFVPDRSNHTIVKVFAVPGSQVGLALTITFGGPTTPRLESFAIPGMQPLDAVQIGGLNNLSAVVSNAGDAVFVRSNDDIEGFTLDPATGALGAAPFSEIHGVVPAFVPHNFGNELGIDPDGTKLIASEPVETPTVEVPTPRITIFDAATGARLNVLDGPTLVKPTLLAVAHPAPEPAPLALAAASFAARWRRRQARQPRHAVVSVC